MQDTWRYFGQHGMIQRDFVSPCACDRRNVAQVPAWFPSADLILKENGELASGKKDQSH